MARVKTFGGLVWIVLLAVNLAVGWILILSQRVSPELAPIVLGIALLFNFPAGLLSYGSSVDWLGSFGQTVVLLISLQLL